MKDIKLGSLKKNNIQYIISKFNCVEKCTILLRINVGSRDETNELKGLSHLLEHMFFQGTKKFKTQKDLLNELYKYGGDFNAFTSKSETVFYITIHNDYVEKALDIISDSFFNSLFLNENLEKEKKVVINEINQYLSDPNTLMFYGLDEITFKNTTFEKDIAGSKETVNKIDINMIKNFINLFYLQNVILSISGNININKTIKLIHKYFNHTINYPCNKLEKFLSKNRILYNNHIFHQKKLNSQCILRKDSQSFIGISFPSYQYNDIKRFKLNIIIEILSGYMGSVLYTELRNKKGLIYHLHMEQENYEDFGQLIISYGTENNIHLIIQSINIIFKELQKLKSKINQKDFNDSKNNLIETLKLKKNNSYWNAYSYSNDYYHQKKILSINDMIKIYQEINLNDLYPIIRQIFNPEYCNICYTGNTNIQFI